MHVPFCPSICPFCSFHVTLRRSGAVEHYLADLDAELAEIAERCPVELDTLYVGGGTPSSLRCAEFDELCAIVERRLGCPRVEFCLEVHPSTATSERVGRWVGNGVNRLSVGVQSFDDGILRALGRTHDADAGRRVVDWCLASGAVVSLDLMMPSPGQDVAADLRAAVATGVHHVSVYALTIEPGTPFAVEGRVVPDGDAADALEAAEAILAEGGYERYEVSNYARPGFRCVHNQAYWRAAPCVGVGPGASGLLVRADGRPVRYTNPRLGTWMAGDGVNDGVRIATSDSAGVDSSRCAIPVVGVEDDDVADGSVVEVLEGEELMGDLLLCGLRLVDGVDLAEVAERSGVDPRVVRAGELERLVGLDLVQLEGSRLRATSRGRLLLDSVVTALI